MKTITKILILALTLHTANLFAQTDVEVVNFTAVLSNVLNLSITAGADQTATFNTPALYNLGLDVVGVTGVTMESTTNWKLSISAPNFTGPAAAIIPINNLGVWCSATGVHVIGTEVTCTNTSLATSRGITVAPQDLINNGSGNSGAALDNAFDLHWTMGTMQGTMNATSLFAQLANGTIASVGTFTTVVTLTLTAL
jgi:hypothetical protein